MKNIFRILCIVLLVSILSKNTQAQEYSKWRSHTQVGIGTPLLSEGYGLSFSVGALYDIIPYVSAEVQGSYTYNKVNNGFLSGTQRLSHIYLLMAGPRVYIVPPQFQVRVYFNALAGLNYNKEIRISDNNSVYYERILALSFGTFIEVRSRYTAGLYFEPAELGLRFGYSF